jgi:hypothetical protein
LGRRSVWEELRARGRKQAVGADDQIVAPQAAVREGDVDPLPVILEALERDAQSDLGASGDGAVTQHLVQGRAADADIGRIAWRQVRRGNPRDLLAVGQVDLDVVEAEPRAEIVIQDAQLGDRAHDVGLLDDADAIDRPVGVPLEDLDIVALLAQGDRRGQAGDTATNNEHLA